MKVLILYPNLPLMISPSISTALFTNICDEEGVCVELFESTAYVETEENSQSIKEKTGAGREVIDYTKAFENIKRTDQMIPDLIEFVEDYKPDLLLMSCVEDTFKDGVEMLKALEPYGIPHIMGGVFPINAPWVAIENEHVNCISIYEGEYVVRDAIRALKDGREYTDIDGIWYKSDGEIIQKPRQPLCDINEYIPDYRLFRDRNRFTRPVGGKARVTYPIETYRGCPYSCTYCNSPTTRLMDRNFMRRKDIDTVKKELDVLLKSDPTPEYLFILDDSFTARPKGELFKLLNVLGDSGIKWWCNTRLDDISEDILSAMKEGGCDRIQFGIESGNEDYRINVLKRRVKHETYIEKAEILNKGEIPYGLNVILGMPNETKEMVLETAKLCKQIGGYDGLGVSIFTPYWGTELREIAVSEGYMEYDRIGTGGLQGNSVLKMPKPYLQPDEILELSLKFKYYAYFDERYWNIIDQCPEDELDELEDIYNKEFFYSETAVVGWERILKRKKSHYACVADEYMEF